MDNGHYSVFVIATIDEDGTQSIQNFRVPFYKISQILDVRVLEVNNWEGKEVARLEASINQYSHTSV